MAELRCFARLTRKRSWNKRFSSLIQSRGSSVASGPGSWYGGRSMWSRAMSCRSWLDKTSSQKVESGQRRASCSLWVSSCHGGKSSLVDTPDSVGFDIQCEMGQVDKALDTMKGMEEKGNSPPVHMYSTLLKACSKRKVLWQAKRVQSYLAERGLDKTRFLGELMVTTLLKCGALEDALQVFRSLPERTVFSWTAIISEHARIGTAREALRMYDEMQQAGVEPNVYTFVSLVKACSKMGDLVECKRVHAEAVKHKCDNDLFLQTGLVDMYGKCGSIVEAQNVFSGLSQRDVVSWTAMLSAYAQQAQPEMALRLYEQMRQEGVSPNAHTFASTLHACGMLAEKEEGTAAEDGRLVKTQSLERGKAIHAHAERKGYDSDLFVACSLVSMYGKCRSISAARIVFDRLPQKNVVTWNVMLVAYAEQSQPEKALQLYEQMRQEGISPNNRTFVSAVQIVGMLAEEEDSVVIDGVPTKVKSLEKGKALHGDARRLGYHSDVFVGNSLISFYGKCGSITDAQRSFLDLSSRDVVAWTSMLTAYVERRQGDRAFQLFEQMKEDGPSPDIHAFLSVIQACAIIAEQEEGILMNGRSTKVESLQKGKILHAEASRKGYASDVFLANGLVCLYGKCGSIDDAHCMFDLLSQRTVVSWNVMLAANVSNAEPEKAWLLYQRMLEQGVCPDVWTSASMLQVCGMHGQKEDFKIVKGQYTKAKCLELGKLIHADARKRGYDTDLFLGSSLISYYEKCGSLPDAWEMFDQLPHKDVMLWTAMIAAYVAHSEPGKALQLYINMREGGISPKARTIVSALQACGTFAAEESVGVLGTLKVKSLQMVKAIHFDAQIYICSSDILVGSTLINSYGRCGSILDAQVLLSGLALCDAVAITAMITAYNELGHGEKAIQLYEQMLEDGLSPDVPMLVSVLLACTHLAEKENDVRVDRESIKVDSLKMGQTIHAEMQRRQIALDVFACCTLLNLYRKCGSVLAARGFFDGMPQQDVALWNAMLVTYVEHGEAEWCLHLYEQMREEGGSPDARTYVSVLQACGLLTEKESDGLFDGQHSRAKCLEIGKAIHAEVQQRECRSDVFVSNSTISMYGKCGSLADACLVFDGMSQRNTVSWNAMLTCYTLQRRGGDALVLYERMQEQLVSADVQTLISVLQGCAISAEEEISTSKLRSKMRFLTKGKAVHAEAQRKGCCSNLALGSTLVRMYSKCGSIMDAQCVFDGFPQCDIVLWNAIIAAYCEHEEGKKALQLYDYMLEEGASPSVATFVIAIQACGVLAVSEDTVLLEGQPIKVQALQKVKTLYAAAQEGKYAANYGLVDSAIVRIYGKCGSLQDAENMSYGLLHEAVESWNVMLALHAEQGEAEKAWQVYGQMLVCGVSADAETFVSMLQACGKFALQEVTIDDGCWKLKSLFMAKVFHAEAWRKGYYSDKFVVSTTIGTLSRCGAFEDAEILFYSGLYRYNVVVWNVMLAAFVQRGQDEKALDLYREMKQEGISSDEITHVCILQACSNTGSLHLVRQIQDTVFSTFEKISPFLASSLISAYGRCASMVDAQRVFDTMPLSDVISWNAIIAGYAREGNCCASLQCFEDMLQDGIAPDKVTFLSLLSVCSYAGWVVKGIDFFESMTSNFGLTPEIEHYICMADLFGRVGNFESIENMLLKMPMLPNLALWLCVLGACRKHCKVVLAERAFDGARRLDPRHASAYALMANIYDDAGLVDYADRVRTLRDKECASKKPGQSWIQHEQEVHTFLAGNSRSVQSMPLNNLLEKVRLETCSESLVIETRGIGGT